MLSTNYEFKSQQICELYESYLKLYYVLYSVLCVKKKIGIRLNIQRISCDTQSPVHLTLPKSWTTLTSTSK